MKKKRLNIAKIGRRYPAPDPLSLLASKMAQVPGVIALDERGLNQLLSTLADVATHAWKASQRLSRSRANIPEADADRLARYLEAIAESLAKAEIEVKDHTGERFDYGQSLKVVASQTRSGIEHEIVAETIRPTVFWKGAMLQQGEVVLDVPTGGDGN